MRYANAYLAAAIGIGAAWLSGQAIPPAGGIAIGACTTIAAMQLVDEWPRYALAGTVYTLGFGLLIALVGPGGEYAKTPMLALLGFGAVSGLVILVRSLGRRGVTRVASQVGGQDYTEEVYTAVSAGVGTVSIIWTVITAKERAAKYSGIAGAGTLGFVLNLFGIKIPIPFWILADGLDATMVLFVGSVVAGFHAISTISATWRAAKTSAVKSKQVGSHAASTATAAAESTNEKVSETAEKAADRTSDRMESASETTRKTVSSTSDKATETKEKTKSVLSRAKDRLRRDDS